MVSTAQRDEQRRRFKVARVQAGLTQAEAAVKAKIPPGRYWWIENGKESTADKREQARLAKVLRMPVEDVPCEAQS